MTVRISVEHPEKFAAGGATFRVLDDGAPTSGRIGVVECQLAPGFAGPPQHVHREHDESFSVLTGTVRFTSGTPSLIARAGQLVTAPIGDPHTFATPTITPPPASCAPSTPSATSGTSGSCRN